MSNVRPHSMRHLIATALLGIATLASATPGPFTGRWSIDLRSPDERAAKKECGGADFELTQEGDRVSGSHSFATVGCGRINDGGPESVKGVVVNGVAVLVVTSSRNGAMVLGTATLKDGNLHWRTREEVRPSDQEGDSPLILESAVLVREKAPR
jgi:hypothetical protein